MKNNQLKAGAMLSLLTFGAANVLGLLYTPYMLRMMGQEEYGLYSLVASVVSYLTMLDFGFGNAIVRYTNLYKASGRYDELPCLYGLFTRLYGLIGIVALFLGIMLFLNIENLFGKTMTTEELFKMRVMMGLLIFNVVFTFSLSVWKNIPVAFERFVFSKSINLFRMLLNPLVMVVLLYYGYKAIALVVVTTIFNILTLLADVWYSKRKLHVTIRFGKIDKVLVREITFYSFWIFLGVIVERIYWSGGQFILGMTSGSAKVAVYAISVQLAYVYMGLGSFLWGIMLPKVTTLVAEKNDKAISDMFVKLGRLQYILMLFVLVGFIVFGKSFILLWAGDKYENAYIITCLFFAALLIPYSQNLGQVIAQAKNQVRLYAVIRLVTSAFGLVLSYFLAEKYSDIGCAVGVFVALLIQTLAINVFYNVKLHLPIYKYGRRITTITLFYICLVVISCFFVRLGTASCYLILAVKILIFCLILSLIMWFVFFGDEEKSFLKNIIRK